MRMTTAITICVCDHHYGWVARNATLLDEGEGQVKCFCYAKLSAQE